MSIQLPRGRQRAPSSVFWPRMILGTILSLAILVPSTFQPYLSSLWTYLRGSSFYRFSSFETIETITLYAIIEPLYTYKFARNPSLRIDNRGPIKQLKNKETFEIPKMRRLSARLGEIFIYVAPLLAMDFTMIKKFADVPINDIRVSGGYLPLLGPNSTSNIAPTFLLPTLHNVTFSSPLQLERALPPVPPTSRRLVTELLTAFFIYDSLFFLVHLAFHRIPISFIRQMHLPHHSHAEIHPQITNRLSICERLSLILLANFSLNIINSHVLTRTIFIPFFVYLLVEVHSGLDLPWGYDKIMPFGLGTGSRVHAIHHRTGEGGYEPFFCWWDLGLEWLEGSDRIGASRRVV